MQPDDAAVGLTARVIAECMPSAGLIESQRRGTWVYYWAVTAMFDRIGNALLPVGASHGVAGPRTPAGNPAPARAVSAAGPR